MCHMSVHMPSSLHRRDRYWINRHLIRQVDYKCVWFALATATCGARFRGEGHTSNGIWKLHIMRYVHWTDELTLFFKCIFFVWSLVLMYRVTGGICTSTLNWPAGSLLARRDADLEDNGIALVCKSTGTPLHHGLLICNQETFLADTLLPSLLDLSNHILNACGTFLSSYRKLTSPVLHSSCCDNLHVYLILLRWHWLWNSGPIPIQCLEWHFGW